MKNKICFNEREETIVRLLFLERIMEMEKSSDSCELIDLYKEIYKSLDNKGSEVFLGKHKKEMLNLLNDKILVFNESDKIYDDSFVPEILDAIYDEYNNLRDKLEGSLA